MKCVLVTGGAGFLGSHLCDRLIESGNYVICLDNFFTGSKENIPDKNYKYLCFWCGKYVGIGERG